MYDFLLCEIQNTMWLNCYSWSYFWCCEASRDFKPHIHNAFDPDPSSLTDVKLQAQRRKICRVSYALPETAASVAIAATVVGAAATLLVRRSRPSEATEVCN